jgi:hypothetical protein
MYRIWAFPELRYLTGYRPLQMKTPHYYRLEGTFDPATLSFRARSVPLSRSLPPRQSKPLSGTFSSRIRWLDKGPWSWSHYPKRAVRFVVKGPFDRRYRVVGRRKVSGRSDSLHWSLRCTAIRPLRGRFRPMLFCRGTSISYGRHLSLTGVLNGKRLFIREQPASDTKDARYYSALIRNGHVRRGKARSQSVLGPHEGRWQGRVTRGSEHVTPSTNGVSDIAPATVR